jgi:hypothetical protein
MLPWAVAFAAWVTGLSGIGPFEKLRHREGGGRDEAIREAAAAGLSLSYIQKITGLGKTTIMRILNDRPRPRP